MKVGYSKHFEKSVRKLSGKTPDSVRRVIIEVKNANNLKQITDCKQLVGYKNVYRIRIGDYRAFFTLHLTIVDDLVFFEYLFSRGKAYGQKMEEALKRIDQ